MPIFSGEGAQHAVPSARKNGSWNRRDGRGFALRTWAWRWGDRGKPFLFARVHPDRGHAARPQSEVSVLIVGSPAESNHAKGEFFHQLRLPNHRAFAVRIVAPDHAAFLSRHQNPV